MTYDEAKQYVMDHDDDDELTAEDLTPVFTALYGRAPDYEDLRAGLWSLCCAMVAQE